ncbi:MAG TPA: hypothetical protein VEC93_16430, partial [Anaerolineae bacterium]|nr:hypothetical protein [Anaerolineae bacterium]
MAQFLRSLFSRVTRVKNRHLWLVMSAVLLIWRLSLNEASNHLIYAKPLSVPAVVYVDDNWVGLANGTVVDADPGPG